MAAWEKWAFPIHSHFLTTTKQHQHFPYPLRCRISCFVSTKLATLYLILEGSSDIHKGTMRAHGCSCEDIQIGKDISGMKDMKGYTVEKFQGHAHDKNEQMDVTERTSSDLANMTMRTSEFRLLMENLDEIENIVAGTGLVGLEREILVHIRRLGALKLFHACLSRTVSTTTTIEQNFLPTEQFRDCPTEPPVDQCKNKVIVCTGRREQRKLRRARASDKVAKMSSLLRSSKRIGKTKVASVMFLSSLLGTLNSSQVKMETAVTSMNEAKMSFGVKVVADLERIRLRLEEKTRKPASYASWAEAAGIDQKTLLQHLQFGWYCRERLIKSTRSLVLYFAKHYRGVGIAFEDLLQAGTFGILKGAERFDNTRGYRFSTYVQYWIKKSILQLVERHSRGVQIPARMQKVISKIQNARRTIRQRDGRYPVDDEIADLTGLSLEKVRVASHCGRVVGAIDKEIGVGWRTKFMDVTLDTTLMPDDEVIMRQHMKEDIYNLLEGLHPNERQVLIQRFGFEDGRCRSLAEIGRKLNVTKEWVRRIEKGALEKLKKENIQKDLEYYLHF